MKSSIPKPPPRPPGTRKLGLSREQAITMSYIVGILVGIFVSGIIFTILINVLPL